MRDDGLRRANPVEKPQNFMETNVIYGILRIMLPVSALAGALFVADENAQAQTPARLPLVTFHSAARGDYFTTSQPGWTCKYFKDCPGPLDADYVVVGLQGEVYNPALPQPPGTLTLYHWFSWERMDNFLTTDPGWAGTVGAVKDIGGGVRYGLFRIEGYIDPPGLPATLPLRSYWNPAEGDNAAVTAWRPDQPAGYGEYRYEGNLLTPDSPDLVRCRTSAAPSSSSAYFSRANYVEVWRSPSASSTATSSERPRRRRSTRSTIGGTGTRPAATIGCPPRVGIQPPAFRPTRCWASSAQAGSSSTDRAGSSRSSGSSSSAIASLIPAPACSTTPRTSSPRR